MNQKLLIAFLIAISALPPMTTDMYLPSLPEITAEFHVTDAETNFTLIIFSVIMGLAALVLGPISDKYGRKPVLIAGFLMYSAGSLLCALSASIISMSAARVLQAAGSGSSMTVSNAIVRDAFTGRRQEGILAIIQSMIMIAPIVAPLIGSFIIYFSDWRGVFFTQSAIGAALLFITLAFKETITEKNDLSVLRSVARLGVLMRHGRFVALIMVFSLPVACIMAFVSTSTYIYQDHYGLSYYQFSVFFGICSVGSVAGPALYMAISKKLSRFSIVTTCFSMLLVTGAATFFFGERSPWLFTFPMLSLCLFCGLVRPAGAYLTLNYHEKDSGSASSLLNSVSAFTGVFGMVAAIMFPRYILATGVIITAVGAVSGTLWVLVSRTHDVG